MNHIYISNSEISSELENNTYEEIQFLSVHENAECGPWFIHNMYRTFDKLISLDYLLRKS